MIKLVRLRGRQLARFVKDQTTAGWKDSGKTNNNGHAGQLRACCKAHERAHDPPAVRATAHAAEQGDGEGDDAGGLEQHGEAAEEADGAPEGAEGGAVALAVARRRERIAHARDRGALAVQPVREFDVAADVLFLPVSWACQVE